MNLKYLAFDLETARPPSSKESGFDLGVTCACAICSDDPDARIWWDENLVTGEAMPQMTQERVQEIVTWLNVKQLDGYKIFTVNGCGFDFRVLAAESGFNTMSRHLAYTHYDIFFQILCMKGYAPGLAALSKGMGGAQKALGMDGDMAATLWPERHEQVLAYVEADARATLDIALIAARDLNVRWISNSGKQQKIELYNWQTVGQSLKLPLPDTSWMSDPMPREQFTSWLDRVKEAA